MTTTYKTSRNQRPHACGFGIHSTTQNETFEHVSRSALGEHAMPSALLVSTGCPSAAKGETEQDILYKRSPDTQLCLSDPDWEL